MKLYNFSLFKRHNQRRLASIIILGVFLCVASEAFAKGKYKPRNRKPPVTRTNVGASRGCPGDEGIPLTSLAPQTFVGETASKRPTFAWYASNSRPVILDLYEFEPSGNKPIPIVEDIEIPTSKGVNKFTLTSTIPELQPGKTYIWQITVRCPNGDTSEPSRSSFKVIKTSASANITTIDAFAREGLWYEALDKALQLPPPGKLGKEGASLVQELAQLENPQDSPDRIKYLQEIAADNL